MAKASFAEWSKQFPNATDEEKEMVKQMYGDKQLPKDEPLQGPVAVAMAQEGAKKAPAPKAD